MFTEQFNPPDLVGLKTKIALYCYGRKGPLGSRSCLLTDKNGDTHSFRFETFYNSYDALTLAVYEKKTTKAVSMNDISKLFD